MPDEIRADMQPFSSIGLWVRPDDDAIFDGVPHGSAAMQGNRCYIRESMWPAVKAELEHLTRMH